MAEKRKEDHGLLAMLGQVFSAKSDMPEADILAGARDRTAPNGTLRDAAAMSRVPEPATPTSGKRTVTAEYLQTVILAGLQEIDGFPRSSVLITVYGVRPWNAMITFAPGSTSKKNATTYGEVLQQLVAKLRERFDVE